MRCLPALLATLLFTAHVFAELPFDTVFKGRAQFDRIIRTSSYEELVKRLRNRGELLRESERPRKTER